jgi:hypothetical protein
VCLPLLSSKYGSQNYEGNILVQVSIKFIECLQCDNHWDKNFQKNHCLWSLYRWDEGWSPYRCGGSDYCLSFVAEELMVQR